jgi:hypothetical protein
MIKFFYANGSFKYSLIMSIKMNVITNKKIINKKKSKIMKMLTKLKIIKEYNK